MKLDLNLELKLRLLKYFFSQVGGGGWEDELKIKTNLIQS